MRSLSTHLQVKGLRKDKPPEPSLDMQDQGKAAPARSANELEGWQPTANHELPRMEERGECDKDLPYWSYWQDVPIANPKSSRMAVSRAGHLAFACPARSITDFLSMFI